MYAGTTGNDYNNLKVYANKLESEVTRLKAEHSVCVLIEQERDRLKAENEKRLVQFEKLVPELEALTAERDRLKAELEALLKRFNERTPLIPDLQAENTRLKAEVVELQKYASEGWQDRNRYRALAEKMREICERIAIGMGDEGIAATIRALPLTEAGK
jgi:predicted  nucleic acid-binding Zn-ribbon protein